MVRGGNLGAVGFEVRVVAEVGRELVDLPAALLGRELALALALAALLRLVFFFSDLRRSVALVACGLASALGMSTCPRASDLRFKPASAVFCSVSPAAAAAVTLARRPLF